MTQVRCLFLQHSTIVSFRYLPQLQYLEELGVEGNRIVSFAHAPHLPSLISINITGAVANGTFNCAACVLTLLRTDNPVARLAFRSNAFECTRSCARTHTLLQSCYGCCCVLRPVGTQQKVRWRVKKLLLSATPLHMCCICHVTPSQIHWTGRHSQRRRACEVEIVQRPRFAPP